MLLVKAGAPVDEFINQLLPYLEEGDIIIDGGNSHFPDSNRRYEELAKKGILFVGSGVSGGEEGARTGPSLMPGGNEKLGHTLKTSSKMLPPRVMVNPVGDGHYVKMVHNGDMCAYDLMKRVGKFEDKEIGDVCHMEQRCFDSFLIEITRDILYYNDPTDGKPLVEKILDTAGQKVLVNGLLSMPLIWVSQLL